MPSHNQFISIGTEAPDFTLPAVSNGQTSLSEFRGEKNVVLVFLRGFMWPFCRRHLAQLRQDYPRFQALETEVLVIASDTQGNARSYFQRNELPFPGLVDETHATYNLYDVQSRLLSLGQRPGLFIVDKSGVVRYAYVGTQQWEIPPNSEVLAQLEILEKDGL